VASDCTSSLSRFASDWPKSWRRIKGHSGEPNGRYSSFTLVDYYNEWKVLGNGETGKVGSGFQVTAKLCRLRWSRQHLLGVYSQGFGILKGFSGSLVQAQLDLVELRLRDGGQVGSSREALAYQQIRIFVRSTPPGALWIAEIDFHIRRYGKVLVLGHLQPAIPS